MLRKTLLLLLVLGQGLLQQAVAQCYGRAASTLDANQANVRLNNSGDQFWDLIGNPGYEVPIGSGKHCAFAMGTWIGGLDQSGALRLAAHTYRQSGIDFGPGPYRTSGQYECGDNLMLTSPLNNTRMIGHSNGTLLVIYGNRAVLWDPATGNTQTSANFPTTFQRFNAKEIPGGQILIVGELLSNGNVGAVLEALFLDPVTLVATPIGVPNIWHGSNSMTTLPNGRVLISDVLGCEVYDPVQNTFTVTDSMINPRNFHNSYLMNNGLVLACPGSSSPTNGGISAVTSFELYDPVSGTWSAGPTGANRSTGTSAWPLANGTYLIIGGNSDVIEIYDPVTNSLSVQGTLSFTVDQALVRNITANRVAVACSESSQNSTSPIWKTFFYDISSSTVTPGPIQVIRGGGTVLASGDFAIPLSTLEITVLNSETLLLDAEPWENIWKVTRSEIDGFLSDYQNNTVNFANYPVIQHWPGNGDTAAGEDLLLAPFIDVDQDGIYDPAGAGDYPCIPGDQAVWWIYNDAIHPHEETGGDPLGVQISCMAYAFDCGATDCPDSTIDYTTFYHYNIKNRGGLTLSDTYLGFLLDADIGNFVDDYVGCDTTRNMGFAFNGDPDDEGQSGYGLNPPAVGTVFLNTPENLGMTNFSYYQNDFSPIGNPETATQYYGYLRSRWKDGSQVTFGGNGYGGTTPTNYMFPGDGGWCGGPATGWSEPSENTQPFDRRYVQSVGPFILNPNQEVKVDLAVVYARGSSGQLSSVCALQTATDTVKAWFESQSHGCFDIALSRQETPAPPVAGLNLYPNPNTGRFTVEWERASRRGGHLELLDLYGRVVRHQEIKAGSRSALVDKSQANGMDMAAGIYLMRIEVDGALSTKKVIIE